MYDEDEPTFSEFSDVILLDQRFQEILEKLKNNEDRVSNYRVHDGLIYYMNHVYVLGGLRLRNEILHHFHNSKEGGHSGWLRTYVRMKQFFFWERLKSKVHKLVTEYDIC